MSNFEAGNRQPPRPGAAAVLAVWPQVLIAQPGGTLKATVVSTEFRDRDFTGFAQTDDGADLVFTSQACAASGDVVALAVDPGRALAFAA